MACSTRASHSPSFSPSPHPDDPMAPHATLRIAEDKRLSHDRAITSGTHVNSRADVRALVKGGIRYPAMGDDQGAGRRGGRGIRVVSAEAGVEKAFKWFVRISASCTYPDTDHFRYMGESPSGQLSEEKALSRSGWKHVEAQILADSTGDVVHL
ncbi:hypothetical protein FIBSPDRAFT_1055917 [Athelia psychrophila]|uniref:Uncharacterized protein n=1 Tax=Athelia psychrophila TaxID=1759441 RepID=A0A167SYT6_9AGAM|nr:hypothetical protein FIBSPDRAFT_1055917 [Fibularhizoctonia sp. CBS 109695]